MSCGCGEPKKPPGDDCSSSSGMFSWFTSIFQDDSNSNGLCKKCGLENCTCNCTLRDHLKECCGLGQLPPLLTKENCPKPTKEEVPIEKPEPCGCEPPAKTADPCKPEVKKDDCAAINWPKEPAPAPAGNQCGCEEPKPPQPPQQACGCQLPETCVENCLPSWICPPTSSGIREYYAPDGVTIFPISYDPCGGRGGGAKGSCGSGCGKDDKGPAAPNVANKACPMLRAPRTCEKKKEEEKPGFFAKLMAFFKK